MGKTQIEWTRGDDGTRGRTWNPVRGCSRVSEGCRNCYAERQAARFSDPGMYAHGFVERTKSGPRWTGKVALVPQKLREPFSWRKPARVFVNSMSDLFHESLPDEAIDQVFAVMALSPEHTFQILTKRPDRMRKYITGDGHRQRWNARGDSLDFEGAEARRSDIRCAMTDLDVMGYNRVGGLQWPPPNVWLGTSIEDQRTADERIPLLLETPAEVRFVSAEPLLGRVDLRPWLGCPSCGGEGYVDMPEGGKACGLCFAWAQGSPHSTIRTGHCNWVIVGGESGPGARPCDIAWIRNIVSDCIIASVPVFCKQLGAVPTWNGSGLVANTPPCQMFKTVIDGREQYQLDMKDRKGGTMDEWPPDLRVRQFPKGGSHAAA